MSLEHHPIRAEPSNGASPEPTARDPPDDLDYWHGLIDEKAAARFLGLTDRSVQKMRQEGGGPHYIRLSSRCLRYRRIDLRAWAETRMRSSTSDPGEAAE